MAQLWGGRFQKQTHDLVKQFNDSLAFDKRLYPQDIRGSIAHVKMLAKQKILTKEEGEVLISGLREIYQEIEEGSLRMGDDYEDIHSFVEGNLIQKKGEVGKKLHTGRSRNDQVALDMKLYIREALQEIQEDILEFLQVLLDLMKEHTGTYMPGFTHLQKAQPITLSHHLGSYFEMLQRDCHRLNQVKEEMATCPLGSGALAGTTYPLDRDYVAKLLGFQAPTQNSLDGVSDRDYLISFLSALSILMMHLSRFSEEIILWNSGEYGFIEIDDGFSTGSSIMPQKKNPDIAELVRGKSGRVYGNLLAILTTMKGLPLAYNKDMQEDKEQAFDSIDTVKICLKLFSQMLSTIRFRKGRMEESAKEGYTNATDVADYLVKKGMAFRDAHKVVGELVLLCLEEEKRLEELPFSIYQRYSSFFEEDIYDAISLEVCVNRRQTTGGPSRSQMAASISDYETRWKKMWEAQKVYRKKEEERRWEKNYELEF